MHSRMSRTLNAFAASSITFRKNHNKSRKAAKIRRLCVYPDGEHKGDFYKVQKRNDCCVST